MATTGCWQVALRAATIFSTLAYSSPSLAQVQYGPWRKTNDCRTIRVPVGPGGGQIEVPQVPVPGRSRSMECKWVREVTDCPRIRDRLRHPIQCIKKKDFSGYSVSAPSS